MDSRDTRRTSNVDLEAMCRRLDTQAQKLQFGVLNAVDFAFKRFGEKNPTEAKDGTLSTMKSEMIVDVVMQAVNTIRGQSRILRQVSKGSLNINKQKEVKT